jgi:hypothetical protein
MHNNVLHVYESDTYVCSYSAAVGIRVYRQGDQTGVQVTLEKEALNVTAAAQSMADSRLAVQITTIVMGYNFVSYRRRGGRWMCRPR